jgi:hypothetical protein
MGTQAYTPAHSSEWSAEVVYLMTFARDSAVCACMGVTRPDPTASSIPMAVIVRVAFFIGSNIFLSKRWHYALNSYCVWAMRFYIEDVKL